MKVRFHIIRATSDKLILVPLADEFTIPIIDNYKDLMQYSLDVEIDHEKLVVCKGWDEAHRKK